ncbi:ribosomal large P0-like protein [Naegleria gruberi]|uniref:Ribosomal large P0-like protein n=1 Tax=Naegleria gruberi TaxID=5762 RepID=D2VJ82_NAEGR|nr:ribosomal large P0-like protein [Naegleria gruberi]EFC43236.1 ribosomal large P0-like protein [Naegleria gruberi]|eukprot:XP_002675980.1 ribosomal large P0-like protein [Naegleria gruberi strain NEG-M]
MKNLDESASKQQFHSEKKGLSHKCAKFEKVIQHFHDHSNVIIIKIHPRMKSDQLQIVRMKLREKAELLVGKNTLIRSAIRNLAQDIQFNVKPSEWKHNPEVLYQICEYLRGNVGLIFTNSTEIEELIEQIQSFKFEAKAKVGDIAQQDVYASTDFLLLRAGEKITKEKADFLELLKMEPMIAYGLKVVASYENSHVVWNQTYENLRASLNLNSIIQEAVDNVASIGLELDIPNSASIPHSLFNGLLNVGRVLVELRTINSIQQFTVNELPSEILILIASFLNLSELNRFAMGNQSLLSLFFNRRIISQSHSIEKSLKNSIAMINEESELFTRVQLEIWKPLVCFYFPNFRKNNLNIKNWLHVLRRRIDHIKLHMPSVNLASARNESFAIKSYEWNLINQCEWIYKCPLKYDSLPLHTSSSRMCNVCNKIVYQVGSEEQAKHHIIKGNCIAFVEGGDEYDDDLAMGIIYWDE